MSVNPYVFGHLQATRCGVPDPNLEVECLLSRLHDVLEMEPATAHDAYDLLAAWAGLRRVRPELIEPFGGTSDLARAERLIDQRGTELAGLALSVPDPDAWREDAEKFVASYDELLAPEVRSTWAERVLADLDDAQLVLYAVRRSGMDDPELEEQLNRCDAWLACHADRFLAASVHIQAMGLSFRPDLQRHDYGLAVTAVKFQDLLGAASAAEEELMLSAVTPWPAQEIDRLLSSMRRERYIDAFSVWRKEQRDRTIHPLMAAAASEALPTTPLFWVWQAPRHDFLARLVVPSSLPTGIDPPPLFLAFVDADHRPAAELAGQPVTVCEVEVTIDADGKARLPLDGLLQSTGPLTLRVGTDRTEWTLVSGGPV